MYQERTYSVVGPTLRACTSEIEEQLEEEDQLTPGANLDQVLGEKSYVVAINKQPGDASPNIFRAYESARERTGGTIDNVTVFMNFKPGAKIIAPQHMTITSKIPEI